MARKESSTKVQNTKVSSTKVSSTKVSSTNVPEFTVEMLDPKSLKPHIQNWRKHDKRQREAYHALREKLGVHIWLLPVLLNKRTGNLLDGHMRVEEAIATREKAIPVRVINVDESTERLILGNLDTIGLIAKADVEALTALAESNRKLLKQSKTKTNKILQQLAKDAVSHKFGIRRSPSVRTKVEPEPEATREDGVYTPSSDLSELEISYINNEVKFQSSNNYELPDLLEDKLATPDMLPTATWTKQSKSEKLMYFCHGNRPFPPGVQGVLGFYTDDRRFNHVYSEADAFAMLLKEENWTALIAPDFSAYMGWPFPEQLFNIYKSRWCARLWQELGFHVIPTVEYIGDRTEDVIYSTLPRCSCVSIQVRNAVSNESIVQQIKSVAKSLKPEAILIYGGTRVQKYVEPYLPRKTRYVFIPDTIEARTKARRQALH